MSTKAVEEKKKSVEEFRQKIDSASVLVLTDYRGISVKEITTLRKKLRKQEAEYKVVKNTLCERAVEAAGFPKLKDYLQGPVALLLGYKEPVAPLKTLVDFLGEAGKGEIKAGIIEKSFMEAKEISEIAKLPSKEVLLSQVVSGLRAPIYGLVNVLRGTILKLVYVLNAIQQKKGG